MIKGKEESLKQNPAGQQDTLKVEMIWFSIKMLKRKKIRKAESAWSSQDIGSEESSFCSSWALCDR